MEVVLKKDVKNMNDTTEISDALKKGKTTIIK
jgi:hypothetical protein